MIHDEIRLCLQFYQETWNRIVPEKNLFLISAEMTPDNQKRFVLLENFTTDKTRRKKTPAFGKVSPFSYCSSLRTCPIFIKMETDKTTIAAPVPQNVTMTEIYCRGH